MVYIPNTDKDRADMLKAIGVNSFEDLISNIPPSLRLKGNLNIPPALSEYEAVKALKLLNDKNLSVNESISFIGGGAYDHFIPAIVDHVISRPEFYTAYTPYQAELSQGTLQVMYEFQSVVSILSGLEVSNASMYDGASALAEAVIMSNNINRKTKVLIAGTMNPNHKEVVKTYIQGIGIQLDEIKDKQGTIDLNDLRSKINDDICAVAIQHPNFLGNLEEMEEINSIIRQFPKVLFIVSYNPMTVGLLKSPGQYGADIAVAEGQPLGIPLSFGGPYLGMFSTKKDYIRKIPGRISGQTIDSKGNEGFVLTLQTREQHIKRERATSNICTNEGLMTIAVLTYLCYMGKEGLTEVASQCYDKAHYLADKISEIDGFKLKFNQEFFNEFVVTTDKEIDILLSKLLEKKIQGGVNLKRFGSDGLLIAVTEKRTKYELDMFVDNLKQL